MTQLMPNFFVLCSAQSGACRVRSAAIPAGLAAHQAPQCHRSSSSDGTEDGYRLMGRQNRLIGRQPAPKQENALPRSGSRSSDAEKVCVEATPSLEVRLNDSRV